MELRAKLIAVQWHAVLPVFTAVALFQRPDEEESENRTLLGNVVGILLGLASIGLAAYLLGEARTWSGRVMFVISTAVAVPWIIESLKTIRSESRSDPDVQSLEVPG